MDMGIVTKVLSESYEEFLRAKVKMARFDGFDVIEEDAAA